MAEEEFEEYEDEDELPKLPRKPLPKSIPVKEIERTVKENIERAKVKRPAPESELEYEDEEPTPRKVRETDLPQRKTEAEPQYVAIPRAVPMETMLNEIYDAQQEIKQMLMSFLDKIK